MQQSNFSLLLEQKNGTLGAVFVLEPFIVKSLHHSSQLTLKDFVLAR
jgi:hypothetical protein